MHICCWSGGKDSTATVILAHENNEPLDLILFSEVMFDREAGISGENPEHIHFVKHVAKPMFESWGYRVEILHADRDYLDVFHHIIERPTKHLCHKGMKYGFTAGGACAVKRDCKEKPIKDFISSIKEPCIQYVGICANEEERLVSLHKDASKVSLLEKYGYAQDMARKKCIEYGLYSPGYKYSKRGGCFFCPYAKLEEHRYIYKTDPVLWERFVALESESNLANNRWNVYGETLKERDEYFRMGFEQLSLFDLV